jgi:hypothetical protein
VLGFVICGTEHSGTTLCSDLFRQVPGVDAGFELGVLLADSPRLFAGVGSHFQYLGMGWGLDPRDIAWACDTDDFVVFYERLQARAAYMPAGTHTIFDKTPRYLAHLDACLARIDVPFIVTCKDPRATVHSDFVRSGAEDFFAWFDGYAPAKLAYLSSAYAQYMRHQSDPRVLCLPLEALCLEAGRSCAAMFAHVGLAFDPRYLVLRDLRYPNTRNESISAGIPFGYRHALTVDMIAQVEAYFASLNTWFYRAP